MDKLISANAMYERFMKRRDGLDGIYDATDLPDMLGDMPAVDAIPTEWLIGKAAQAERDLYYCKGDAKKNADIMAAVRVVMGLWKKEGKDAQSNGHGK